MSTNHYSFIDYRKLIAWDKRLAREWQFLGPVLAGAPSKRVLDLGSGTGEHARYFAGQGYSVVGVDVSDAMLDRAREGGVPDGVEFLKGDLVHVGREVAGLFGAAVCLGNTLAHVSSAADLAQLCAGVRARLVPGAPFVLQMLNYEHFVHANQRSLPVTFIEDEDGDAVFLRLMTFQPGGRVIFTPTVLRYRPDAEPAVEVETSHNVELHGWTRGAVEAALAAAGFGDRRVYGAMSETAFTATDSHDLVVVAR